MHLRGGENFTLSEGVIVGMKQVAGVGPICKGSNSRFTFSDESYLVRQNYTK